MFAVGFQFGFRIGVGERVDFVDFVDSVDGVDEGLVDSKQTRWTDPLGSHKSFQCAKFEV